MNQSERCECGHIRWFHAFTPHGYEECGWKVGLDGERNEQSCQCAQFAPTVEEGAML